MGLLLFAVAIIIPAIGIVGFFTGSLVLLIIGGIVGAVMTMLLKGAPYPRVLIFIVSLVISLLLVVSNKAGALDGFLLLLCINPILANLYGKIFYGAKSE